MSESPQSFEEVYRQLEDTVEKLERGGMTLEDTLSHFERGMNLADACLLILERASLRVTRVTAQEAE